MSPRIPSPPDDPIVERLRKPNSREVEDVISLVGYIGPGRDESRVRIYAERDLVRFLEVPAPVVDSQPLYPDDQLSPSVVWVERSVMLEQIFGSGDTDDGRIDAAIAALGDVPFSVWNLIPETRYVAARLLGLIPYEED